MEEGEEGSEGGEGGEAGATAKATALQELSSLRTLHASLLALKEMVKAVNKVCVSPNHQQGVVGLVSISRKKEKKEQTAI